MEFNWLRRYWLSSCHSIFIIRFPSSELGCLPSTEWWKVDDGKFITNLIIHFNFPRAARCRLPSLFSGDFIYTLTHFFLPYHNIFSNLVTESEVTEVRFGGDEVGKEVAYFSRFCIIINNKFDRILSSSLFLLFSCSCHFFHVILI